MQRNPLHQASSLQYLPFHLRQHAVAASFVALLNCLGPTGTAAASELGLRSEITGSSPAGGLTLTHTLWNPGTTVVTNVWLTNQLPAGVSIHATNKWPIGSPGPTYPEPQLPPLTLAAIKPGVTFDLPWTATNPPAVAVAVGDLDRDGWPDLVVAHGTNANGFSVWRSSGTNSSSPPRVRFTAVGTFSDASVRDLAIGDFNGDGRPDVAVAELGRDTLKTFFQAGDIPTAPQFALGTSNGFSSPITGIAVMDFDGDGLDDLAVLEPAAAKVHLLRNALALGLPGFTEVGSLDTPPAPTALGKEKKRPGRESPTLASLGRLFVTSDASGGVVSVYIPSGSVDPAKLYLPPALYACGPTPRDIGAGDLDGDGLEDLVVANGSARTVTLLRSGASGDYVSVGIKDVGAVGNVNALHLLDLDGDGRPEIITGSAGANGCIVLPNSRTPEPLHPGQFGAPVHFDLPAPFRNLGFDAHRDGSQAGGFIVVGHAGPNQGSLAGGQSFTALGLTQPGAVLAVPLGDLDPGAATGVSLELGVRVPDATNTAFARATGGGPGPSVVIPIKIPLATICGGVYCVSGGLTQGMGGFAVTVAINGTGYAFTNSTVTMPDGSYCLELPFSCGGVFPWDTTITVTTPACPGQSWVFPINVLFASMTIPPVYCNKCTACTNVQNVMSLFSGRGPSGPLPAGSLDPQFTTGNPPFTTLNPYVTPANTGWLANGPNSKWVGPDPLFQSFAGLYCYTNTFYLPCTNSAQIAGLWTIAGSGAAVLLNGAFTGISLSGVGLEANWYPFSLNSGFVAGWNTLVFCVTNPPSTDGTPFTPTGLRTELTGRATCCTGCADIHCPTNMVVEVCTNGPAPYGQFVNYPPPAAFSYCATVTNVVCLPPSGSFFPLGTNVVTCIVYDSLGNSAACSFNIIVRPDFTPPTVLQCPPLNISVTGCPPVLPDFTTNVVVVDNCTPPNQLTITQSILPGTPLSPGQTVVIVRVCDGAGNCRDCDVIVTAIPDPSCCTKTQVLNLFSGSTLAGPLPGGTVDPQFQTGLPLFSTASPYVPSIISGWWLPNTTASKWVGPYPNYANAPAGVFFFTNRFFLCSTNQAQVTGRWTADDSGRIWLNGLATTNVLPSGWAFTNWHPVSITSGFVPGWNQLVFAVTNGLYSPTGLRTEITGSACCNTCVTISCPPDITTNTCASGVAVSYSAPAVISSCGSVATVTCTPPSGSFFPIGTNVVTCTAIDAQGNAATCSFLVKVQGIGQPVAITCPPNQTIYTCGSTAVAHYKASASGQAGTVTYSPPSGSTFPLGTNVVTCTATNACGAVASCQFLVIVKPALQGPPSYSLLAGLPDNYAVPVEPSPSNTCMVAAFGGYPIWKGFDDPKINTLLGHRFTGLPSTIAKAELVVRMVPGNNAGSDNDGIFIGMPSCISTSSLWIASIKTLPGAGGTWMPGHPSTTFTLDLGALNPALLTYMNSAQLLDVAIHDDTTVDYMELRLWTCPPPFNPNGPPHWTKFGSALSVMPQPDLPAFGPIGSGPVICIAPPNGDPALPNSVEIGLGGGQAFSFTTILDMNAPEGSQIVVSTPTNDGTNAPLLTLVKGKCPPKCNWDIKMNKKFYDGGSAARVSAVNTNGDLLDSFIETAAEADSDAALTLYPEDGIEQFPVSFLFDASTGEVTVMFPGSVARRLCNGLPCPRGWDGTIKGRVTEAARRKGWDGTVKCPCYDENASRVVFTPGGTNPLAPLTAVEISSTGLSDLVLAAEQLVILGETNRPVRIKQHGPGSNEDFRAAAFQGVPAGNGVSVAAVDAQSGVSLDLGNAASFDVGIHHFENADLPTQEQLFRIGGPKWPPGTTTNRPPPPPIDVRLAQAPDGVECYVDFYWLGLTNVTVQLWTNGVLIGQGEGPGNILATDPVVLSDWPERLQWIGSQQEIRLTSSTNFSVSGIGGNELRILPGLPPGTLMPISFSTLDCLASEGVESLLYELRATPAAAPVRLSLERTTGGVTVSWADERFRLQGAESLSGPWLDLGVSSPATLSGGATARFFRLTSD